MQQLTGAEPAKDVTRNVMWKNKIPALPRVAKCVNDYYIYTHSNFHVQYEILLLLQKIKEKGKDSVISEKVTHHAY